MRCSLFRLGRTPMIQFRYGMRPPAAVAAATAPLPSASPAVATTAAPVVAAAAPAQVFDSPWDLPPHLRPHLISEEEIEFIRFGGASPYPQASDSAKGGAKGGKRK